MNKYLIIIGGISASGKTYYGKYIAEKLKIPFVSKDSIKENLYDVLEYDTSKREINQKFGMASYKVFFNFAETLMKADVSFILESNFIPDSKKNLLPLIEKYNYHTLTILFDADIEVLHKRFLERDISPKRHKGLVSIGYFNDYELFKNAMLPIRDFNVGGERIVVDTTDFDKVSYNDIDEKVINFINIKNASC